MYTLQERKWLSKSGGASSNLAAIAAPSILPKGGGGVGRGGQSTLNMTTDCFVHQIILNIKTKTL